MDSLSRTISSWIKRPLTICLGRPGQSHTVPGDSGNKHTSGKGENQSYNLCAVQLLLEEQNRHQHDPDGRCIQKDCSSGQRHHRDSRKVTDCEHQDTSEPESQKQRQVPQRNPESRAVLEKQHQSENQSCHGKPDGCDLNGIEAKGAQLSDENPHAAPEAPCQNNQFLSEIPFFIHRRRLYREPRKNRTKQTDLPRLSDLPDSDIVKTEFMGDGLI